MRHHVGCPGGRLICGKREREFRVHHGELGAQGIGRAQAELYKSFPFGYHAVARAFAPGGGNGEHNAHGQRMFYYLLSAEEVPEVAVVNRTGGNGLGCVDNRTAAHADNHVGLESACPVDTFVHLVVHGIGMYSAQHVKLETCGLERITRALKHSAAHSRAATVNHKSARTAVACGKFAGLHLDPAAEDVLRRAVKHEIFHKCYVFYLLLQK